MGQTLGDLINEIGITPQPPARNGPYPRRPAPAGMTAPGNIDLADRPMIRNADGSVSTVRSIGVDFGGRHFLLPTVSDEGILSNQAAIDRFRRTGQNLGEFSTDAAADNYGQQLHEEQAQYYSPQSVAARAYYPAPPPTTLEALRSLPPLSGGQVLGHTIDNSLARFSAQQRAHAAQLDQRNGLAYSAPRSLPQVVGDVGNMAFEATGLPSARRAIQHVSNSMQLGVGDQSMDEARAGTSDALMAGLNVALMAGPHVLPELPARRLPAASVEEPATPLPQNPTRDLGYSNGSLLPVRPREPFRQSMVGGSADLAEAALPQRRSPQQQAPDAGGAGREQLRTFLDGEQPNGWLQIGDYEIYLRKGERNLPGGAARTVEIANIHRTDGLGTSQVLPQGERGPRGHFRSLVADIEREAAARGYGAVYVENMQNKFLPGLFQRAGYAPDEAANAFNSRSPSAYRLLGADNARPALPTVYNWQDDPAAVAAHNASRPASASPDGGVAPARFERTEYPGQNGTTATGYRSGPNRLDILPDGSMDFFYKGSTTGSGTPAEAVSAFRWARDALRDDMARTGRDTYSLLPATAQQAKLYRSAFPSSFPDFNVSEQDGRFILTRRASNPPARGGAGSRPYRGTVFHGGPAAVEGSWRPNTFFGATREKAGIYAYDAATDKPGVVHEAQIELRNPYRLISDEPTEIGKVLEIGNPDEVAAIADRLKAQGYDGIVVQTAPEDTPRNIVEVLAFDPEQAISNARTPNGGAADAARPPDPDLPPRMRPRT